MTKRRILGETILHIVVSAVLLGLAILLLDRFYGISKNIFLFAIILTVLSQIISIISNITSFIILTFGKQEMLKFVKKKVQKPIHWDDEIERASKYTIWFVTADGKEKKNEILINECTRNIKEGDILPFRRLNNMYRFDLQGCMLHKGL